MLDRKRVTQATVVIQLAIIIAGMTTIITGLFWLVVLLFKCMLLALVVILQTTQELAHVYSQQAPFIQLVLIVGFLLLTIRSFRSGLYFAFQAKRAII